MKSFLGATFLAAMVFGSGVPARADGDKDAAAVVDKGIKALGGADKLRQAKALSWELKGKITLDNSDNDFTARTVAQDLDHYRSQFEGEFGGNKIEGITILNGNKGWRKFMDNVMELDKDSLVNEKRTAYLQIVPATLLPLKDKGFKIKSAGEDKVAGKPATAIKVTGPDGKDFKLWFDKETGLPVKMVAKVTGFQGDEYTQESMYSAYKDFGGVKKATKTESKRDGEKFITVEVTGFKVLDKVDPKTFEEPK